MGVQDIYDSALKAIDERRWKEAEDLLTQVQAEQPGFGDSERLLETAQRLAQAEEEMSNMRTAADRTAFVEEHAPADKVGGPAWVGLALFLVVIGVIVTVLNLLMQSGG